MLKTYAISYYRFKYWKISSILLILAIVFMCYKWYDKKRKHYQSQFQKNHVNFKNEQMVTPKVNTVIDHLPFDRNLVRAYSHHGNHKKFYTVPEEKRAIARTDATELIYQFEDKWQWRFIKKRVMDLWPTYQSGLKYLLKKNLIEKTWTKRKIIIFPGLLSLSDFAQHSAHGGPLGELVQWADLIAALYILGHDLELQHKPDNVDMGLKLQLRKEVNNQYKGCENEKVDYIFTDLLGHEQLSDEVTGGYRLKFRILDHFGTEQMYNNPTYAIKHGLDKHCGKWGLRNLNLKQFYTGYPLSPDNSFLGFVIDHLSVNPEEIYKQKQNISYIYGKDLSYMQGREEFEKIVPLLKKFTEVHTTLPTVPDILKNINVVNHGHLDRKEFLQLAEKAKLVVGVGRPEEGPGVLEAISRGAVFLNPKRDKHWKYDGKPTNRTLTSQNPYAEKYIGSPHVYTLDYSNLKQAETVILHSLTTQVRPFIPFELQSSGYLQRLSYYMEKQDFCNRNNQTFEPPLEALLIVMGKSGQSCTDTCEMKGLVCENLYFESINNKTVISNYLDELQSLSQEKRKLPVKNSNIAKCETFEYRDEVIYAPAFLPDQSTCVLLQKDIDLFSCSSYLQPKPNINRICPCREYERFQIALCKGC